MNTDSTTELLVNRRALTAAPEAFELQLKRTLLLKHQTLMEAGAPLLPRFSRVASGVGIGLALVAATLILDGRPPTSNPLFDDAYVVAAVMKNPELQQALTLIDDEIADIEITSVTSNSAELTITTVKRISFTAIIDARGQLIALGPKKPTSWTIVFYPSLLTPDTHPRELSANEHALALKLAVSSGTVGGILEGGGEILQVAAAYVEIARIVDYDPESKTMISTEVIYRKIAQILVRSGEEDRVYFVDLLSGLVAPTLESFYNHSGSPIRTIVPKPGYSGTFILGG